MLTVQDFVANRAQLRVILQGVVKVPRFCTAPAQVVLRENYCVFWSRRPALRTEHKETQSMMKELILHSNCFLSMP